MDVWVSLKADEICTVLYMLILVFYIFIFIAFHMFVKISFDLNMWYLYSIFSASYCDKSKWFFHFWTMNMNKSFQGWMLEEINMVDRINYQPNMMQLVILHSMYIVFCHIDVIVCLLIANSIAPQFQMNKQQSSKNFSSISYPNINPTVYNWWSLH